MTELTFLRHGVGCLMVKSSCDLSVLCWQCH